MDTYFLTKSTRSCGRKTIGKEIGTFDLSADVKDITGNDVKFHHATDYAGYVNRGKKVIFEYAGKFGKGYVVCVPKKNRNSGKYMTNMMTVNYYILA